MILDTKRLKRVRLNRSPQRKPSAGFWDGDWEEGLSVRAAEHASHAQGMKRAQEGRICFCETVQRAEVTGLSRASLMHAGFHRF